MKKKINVKIRESLESDEPFFYNSWLRSFKPSYFAGPIPNDMYWDVYSAIIGRLLGRSKVFVACDPDSENVIYGYLVVEYKDRPVVHWMYVKQSFRGFGIALQLAEAAKVTEDSYYTFRTADCRALCGPEGVLKNSRFRPAFVRNKEEDNEVSASKI